jgi:heptosyltransferase-2
MAAPSKRIVLIAPTWIGDAVMSLPLVGLIAAARGAGLTVVARERSARVYGGIREVSDLAVFADSNRAARIAGVRRLLRRIGADGVIVLPPSFSTALPAFLAGTRVRAGVRSDGRGVLLNAPLRAAGLRETHLSQNYLALGRMVLERLGLRHDHPFGVPPVRVFEADRVSLRRRFDSRGRGGYAVVVPGATYGPTKTWPREKYRELVGLLSKDTRVVLGGSAVERGLCDYVRSGARDVVNLAGETTLGEFMSLLEDASFVVANDSGAPHLAASLATPVVVIFGSTSPTWTSPLGDNVHVVREPVHCSPCFRRRCPTHLECYQGISVERVARTAHGAARKDPEKKVSR